MQITLDVREDWLPIITEVVKVVQEVMAAGEVQRVSKGLDPNGWVKSDPVDRMGHVLRHILMCHDKGRLNVLTRDTTLEEWKHALCGLGIIAALEAKKHQPVGLVIEVDEAE